MQSLIPYGHLNTLGNWINAINDLANMDVTARAEAVPACFKMDVQENADGYIVEATMAGVAREEIDVELNEGRLVIAVDKKEPVDVESRNYVLRETGAYRAVRSIYLKDADTAGLTASLKDGMLTVKVPKRTQNANVTKIEIC